MKTGIFGGTFDPPHIGHLILAAEAYYQLGLDRLLWVLTPEPPHKIGQPITPVSQRLLMLETALAENPTFEISRAEIDRPAPHYAVDTMHLLRQEYPEEKLYYVMGGDSLADLPSWRQPQAFLAACDGLGVMCRPGRQVDLAALEPLLPGLSGKVYFIEAPLLEISSRQLRRRLREGRPYRYYLSPAVYRLIRDKGFYCSR